MKYLKKCEGFLFFKHHLVFSQLRHYWAMFMNELLEYFSLIGSIFILNAILTYLIA